MKLSLNDYCWLDYSGNAIVYYPIYDAIANIT